MLVTLSCLLFSRSSSLSSDDGGDRVVVDDDGDRVAGEAGVDDDVLPPAVCDDAGDLFGVVGADESSDDSVADTAGVAVLVVVLGRAGGDSVGVDVDDDDDDDDDGDDDAAFGGNGGGEDTDDAEDDDAEDVVAGAGVDDDDVGADDDDDDDDDDVGDAGADADDRVGVVDAASSFSCSLLVLLLFPHSSITSKLSPIHVRTSFVV
jgi:hypothetical protein